MVTLSRKTAARLLTLMRDHCNLISSPDNAGVRALVDRGHATVEPLVHAAGHQSQSRIYRITPAGRDWLSEAA